MLVVCVCKVEMGGGGEECPRIYADTIGSSERLAKYPFESSQSGRLRQTAQPSSVYSSQTLWRGRVASLFPLTRLVITEVGRRRGERNV